MALAPAPTNWQGPDLAGIVITFTRKYNRLYPDGAWQEGLERRGNIQTICIFNPTIDDGAIKYRRKVVTILGTKGTHVTKFTRHTYD